MVIVVLSFAMAMLISIPPSITASQAVTQKTLDKLTANSQTVNANMSVVASQIDCHLPVAPFSNVGPNNQSVLEQPLMNITDYANLTTIEHIAAIIPIFDQPANDTTYDYNIYGIPLTDASLLESYSLLLPSNITEGRNLQAHESGVVVLQERIAHDFDVNVGGNVKLLNRTFEVVGINGYSPLNETAAYMNLNDAWAATNTTGYVTNFMVFAENVTEVEDIANQISLMFPKLTVSINANLVYSIIQMQTQIEQDLQIAQSVMSQIQDTGTMEIAVVIAVDTAIVLFIMLYTVRERTREIGTLKALGAGNLTVLGQFMVEGILLSFIAGLVGLAIGTFGATSLAGLLLPAPTQAGNSTISSTGVSLDKATSASISVNITPELIIFGLGIAVILGALGSLYPAWRAARTRPAEAMRYD